MDETYRPLVHEIFTKVNNAKVKAKKIAILKQYDTKGLRRLLKAAFDPSISFMLPDGDVPFIANEAPEGTEHTRLEMEARALQNFVQKTINNEVIPGNKNLNTMKREMMFIQLLEGLCEGEARALLHIKNKTLNKKYQGLNSANVRTAFGWNEKFMQDG